MRIDLAALGSVLAQYVVIIGGLAAAYWGIVRWLRRVAGASERAEANLRTTNAKTTGQLIEANHDQMSDLKRELEVLTSWTGENRDGWQRALRVAERAAAMIDAHLAAHDREGATHTTSRTSQGTGRASQGTGRTTGRAGHDQERRG